MDNEHEEEVPAFGSKRRFIPAGISRNAVLAIGALLVGVFCIVITAVAATMMGAHRAHDEIAQAKETPPAPVFSAPGAIVDATPAASGTVVPLDGGAPSPLASAPQLQTPVPIATPAGVTGTIPAGAAGVSTAQCQQEIKPGYVGEIDPTCDPTGQFAQRRNDEQNRRLLAQSQAQSVASMGRHPAMRGSFASMSGNDDASKGLEAASMQKPDFDPRALPSLVPMQAADAGSSGGEPVYKLKTGWRLPVAFQSSVNLEFPGPVTAVTTENVLDTDSGRYNLIPMGTFVMGRTGGATTAKDRADVYWTLMRLPGGKTVALGTDPQAGMVSQDRLGANGVDASVNDHRSNIIRTSFVSTVVAALAAEATNKNNNSNNVVSISNGPTPGTVIAQGVFDTANRINNLDAYKLPSLTIPAAKPFKIYIDHDVALPPFDGRAVVGSTGGAP